jgi:hypothetical protein
MAHLLRLTMVIFLVLLVFDHIGRSLGRLLSHIGRALRHRSVG